MSLRKCIFIYNRTVSLAGFLGEIPEKKLTKSVLVKDHLLRMKIKPEFKSAILLIRNPHDAFIADWSRQKTGKNHIGVPKAQVFHGQGIYHLFHNSIPTRMYI